MTQTLDTHIQEYTFKSFHSDNEKVISLFTCSIILCSNILWDVSFPIMQLLSHMLFSKHVILCTYLLQP